MAQCPCNTTNETTTWKPDLTNSFNIKGGENGNFDNTINGVYVSADKDSIYQIKILIEPQSWGTFVHFQHISFYAKDDRFKDENVGCSSSTLVHDGGWFGRSIYAPNSSINKRFVASRFFESNQFFDIGNGHPYVLYKCEKEWGYGILDRDKSRYYRKVFWQPKGNYPEISLFHLFQKDLKKYNKEQLSEMRNEVFARYNYAFKEKGKWFKFFDKLGNYRWNYFDDVTHFITSLEKENLDYIKGFSSADYYDNQLQNDFLDFWHLLRKNVKEQNTENLIAQVKFPFEIHGEDDEAVIKIGKEQFAKIWQILLLQENYDLNNQGKLTSSLTKSIFNNVGAFDELMINTKENSINNLNFSKINEEWKIGSAYADFGRYEAIEKLIKEAQK